METQTVLSDAISCFRGTSGYVDDKAGVWSLCLGNVPRVSDKGLLVEEQRTNFIRNNSMQGTVAGTPGTLPTNWGMGQPAGTTRTVVGKGTENGIDYVDLRINGTTTNTNSVHLNFDSYIAAATGQKITISAFVRLVAGSWANVTSQRFTLNEFTSGNVFVTQTFVIIAAATATLGRRIGVVTTVGATTAKVSPYISFIMASGVAVDFTIRIGWPQMELGEFATSPIRTINASVTRSADVISVLNPVQIINQVEQTIFFEMTPHMAATAASQDPVQVGWVAKDFSNTAYMASDHNLGTDDTAKIGPSIMSGGVQQVTDWTIGEQPTTRFKCIMAIATNNVRGALNGTLGPLDTAAAMPVGPPTRATIGSGPWQITNLASGYYHKVWFIPSREPDEFLNRFTRHLETLNPLDAPAEIILTNNNLTVARSAVAAPSYRTVRSTNTHSNGKYYFEMKQDISADINTTGMGLATAAHPLTVVGGVGGWLGQTVESIGVWDTGSASYDSVPSGNKPFIVGEWVGLAVDIDAGKFWFRNAGGFYVGVFNPTDCNGNITLSNGNLTATVTGPPTPTDQTAWLVRSVNGHNSGKRYFEMRWDDYGRMAMGIGKRNRPLDQWMTESDPAIYASMVANDGTGFNGETPFTIEQMTLGQSAGLAIDFDAGKAWVRTPIGWVGNPEAGTGNSISFTPGTMLYAGLNMFFTGMKATANFGSEPFFYLMPAGWQAWGGELSDPATGVGPDLTFPPEKTFYAAICLYDIGYQATANFGGTELRVQDASGLQYVGWFYTNSKLSGRSWHLVAVPISTSTSRPGNILSSCPNLLSRKRQLSFSRRRRKRCACLPAVPQSKKLATL